MKTTLHRRTVRLSLALCLACASHLTMTQTLAADDGSTPDLAEVVVTAPRAISATKSDTPNCQHPAVGHGSAQASLTSILPSLSPEKQADVGRQAGQARHVQVGLERVLEAAVQRLGGAQP